MLSQRGREFDIHVGHVDAYIWVLAVQGSADGTTMEAQNTFPAFEGWLKVIFYMTRSQQTFIQNQTASSVSIFHQFAPKKSVLLWVIDL